MKRYSYLCTNDKCNHRQYSNSSTNDEGVNWDCEVCGDWTVEEGPIKKDSNMAVFFTLLLIALFLGMGVFA